MKIDPVWRERLAKWVDPRYSYIEQKLQERDLEISKANHLVNRARRELKNAEQKIDEINRFFTKGSWSINYRDPVFHGDDAAHVQAASGMSVDQLMSCARGGRGATNPAKVKQ